MDELEVRKQIVKEIKDFTDIAVIGLSGGADSTLVVTLCTEALGSENVYGYGMPYNSFDEDTFNTRSGKLAKKLDINYEELSIGYQVEQVAKGIDPEGYHGISPLNFGNIKSRMRMVYLYSLGARITEKTGKRVRVIGTGNLSEDFIGYDTKGGDALADIFPIGELYKSEVYQLLDLYVDEGILDDELIDRVPSAGLEDGQTDEDDLGYSYNEMQPAIEILRKNPVLYKYPEVMDKIKKSGKKIGKGKFLSFTERELEVIDFVWNRHIVNHHKHTAPKVISLQK